MTDLQTFPLFPSLPPELRHQIWLSALSHPSQWSFTHFRRGTRRKPGIKIAGHLPRAISQTSREARAAALLTHHQDTRFGPIDFARHIFFFRDNKHDGDMLAHVAQKFDILHRVQHIALHPREFWRLRDTFDVVLKHCTALKTVIFVGGWIEPHPKPWTREVLDLMPYLDEGRIYKESPAEMDLASLVEAIETGAAAEAKRREEYRERLSEIVDAASHYFEEEDISVFWHVRHVLGIAETLTASLPGDVRLYIRRRDELCPQWLLEAEP